MVYQWYRYFTNGTTGATGSTNGTTGATGSTNGTTGATGSTNGTTGAIGSTDGTTGVIGCQYCSGFYFRQWYQWQPMSKLPRT